MGIDIYRMKSNRRKIQLPNGEIVEAVEFDYWQRMEKDFELRDDQCDKMVLSEDSWFRHCQRKGTPEYGVILDCVVRLSAGHAPFWYDSDRLPGLHIATLTGGRVGGKRGPLEARLTEQQEFLVAYLGVRGAADNRDVFELFKTIWSPSTALYEAKMAVESLTALGIIERTDKGFIRRVGTGFDRRGEPQDFPKLDKYGKEAA